MDIEFTKRFFPTGFDALEEDLRDRIAEHTANLTAQPSHVDWFDVNLFKNTIRDLALCELHLEDLDVRIITDPIRNAPLEKLRGPTASRVAKLRIQLGMDAQRIKQLTKGKRKKKPHQDIVAKIRDEDHQP